jgi:hypothetical protein
MTHYNQTSRYSKMSISSVIKNHYLFSYIVSFLSDKNLKQLAKGPLGYLIHESVVPTSHTLIYGQVQSGKTAKIMEYVKNYRPDVPKILVMQNSLSMLEQYSMCLKANNISYKVINKSSAKEELGEEKVLLTMNNKFRMRALSKYIDKNKYQFNKFNMILDESDQYLKNMSKNIIFNKAKHILHVTATPFKYQTNIKYKKKFQVDEVIMIKPKNDSYLGINDVKIIEKILEPTDSKIFNEICNIINLDFNLKTEGIMLVTCFRFVSVMRSTALSLSLRYTRIPIIVLSTKTTVYLGGLTGVIKDKNVKNIFDKFKKYSHVIIIANRLSNRGINYTDSTYTKHITHQVLLASSNYTSFLQKCRIFGLRNQITIQPVIYCLINNHKNLNFADKLKYKIQQLTNRLLIKDDVKVKKVTIQNLKQICRENGIRGYSRLKKLELIELLEENLIDHSKV